MKDFYSKEESMQIISSLVIVFMEAMQHCGITAETAMEVLDTVDQKLMDKIFGGIVGE